MEKHINIVYKEMYKMQKIVEIKDFDSFIMERKENNVKRDKFIEQAVSKIKKRIWSISNGFHNLCQTKRG